MVTDRSMRCQGHKEWGGTPTFDGGLQPMGGAKFADNFGGVAVLTVNGFVHGAHVVGGDVSGEGVEGRLDLRPAAERVVADERHGLVGREVVAVVLKDGEVKGLDGAVGGIGGNHVDL